MKPDNKVMVIIFKHKNASDLFALLAVIQRIMHSHDRLRNMCILNAQFRQFRMTLPARWHSCIILGNPSWITIFFSCGDKFFVTENWISLNLMHLNSLKAYTYYNLLEDEMYCRFCGIVNQRIISGQRIPL